MSLTTKAPLPVAVVGCGAMGGNHARVLSHLKGVELAAVVDPDPTRAQTLAAKYDCAWFTDPSELVGKVKAVSLCASSSAHHAVGLALLSAGLPCLIEKPLATTAADCQALIDAADKADVALAVGHIERWNPAVLAARDILKGQEIQAIEARRFNPGSARITDTDVVIDLMVHDLDVAMTFMGGAPDDVTARGITVIKPGLPDHATALLSYGTQSVVSLSASRIAPMRVRELHLTTCFGVVSVDYIAQSVVVTRPRGADRAVDEWSATSTSHLDTVVDKLFVRNGEALAAELEAFCGAVASGRKEEAGVLGPDALASLQVVWRIQQALAG